MNEIETFSLIFIDEFGSIVSGELDIENISFLTEVIDNTSSKIIFKQCDPNSAEYVVNMIGIRIAAKVTMKMDEAGMLK